MTVRVESKWKNKTDKSSDLFHTSLFKELLAKNTAKGTQAVGISSIIDEYWKLTNDSRRKDVEGEVTQERDSLKHITPKRIPYKVRYLTIILPEQVPERTSYGPILINAYSSPKLTNLLDEVIRKKSLLLEKALERESALGK